MILFLDGTKVYAWNEDNTIKQLEEYLNDDEVILAEHITEIPKIPKDDGLYEYYWNGIDIDVIRVGTVEPPQPTPTEQISVLQEELLSTNIYVTELELRFLELESKLT